MEKETAPEAIICVDYSNYHYYLRNKGWRIDWEKFVACFQKLYTIKRAFYYEGIPSKAVYLDQHPTSSLDDFNEAKRAKLEFHRVLARLGWVVRSKLVNRLYDRIERQYKHKCNFDVEITVDVLDNLSELDVLILS